LYTELFGDWIDEPGGFDETCAAAWLTTDLYRLRRIIGDYDREGLSIFASNPILYREFAEYLHQVRSRMRVVRRAIQNQLPISEEPFSPLLVLQIRWEPDVTNPDMMGTEPLTVGDMLVSILNISAYTEETVLRRKRFGPFFAALFIYLRRYREINSILEDAWGLHMVMERDYHARSVTELASQLADEYI
jgi:hypothetical protein